MTRTIASLASLAVHVAAMAAPALAQPTKVYLIGVVLPFEREPIDRKAIPVQRPLEEGLRDLGWVDGRNVRLVWRPMEAVDELVAMPVDVIVSFGHAGAAVQATKTIPIVAHMSQSPEHVGASAGKRLAPNITGISVEAHPALAQKRLQLLKEAAGIKRVARLYLGPPLRFGSVEELLPEYKAAARALGLEVFPVWAGSNEEIRAALREIARRGNVGISFGAYRRSLPGMEERWDILMAEVARHRLPAISDIPLAADEGAMMGFGEDIPKRARRLAHFVDRILKGARPADLPIEQPVSFDFVVNLDAAESIGVKLPQSILLQADRVVR